MKRLMMWVTSFLVAILLAGTIATTATASQSTPSALTFNDASLQAAVDWLVGQQHETGGFTGMSGEPEVSITVDAVVALVSAQLRGIDVGSSIDDAVAFLESGEDALVYVQTGVGQAAKLATGVVAYGADPRDISGVNPLSLVQFGVSADTGFYGGGPFDHALALLALGATGSDVPDEAITVLETSQTPEGGWSFDSIADPGAGDSNTTAMVVMGLVATGHGDSPMIGTALAYLQTTLVGSSGATFQPSEEAVADANSTALVLQAVIAVGDDPASESWGDLVAALAAFQNESGAYFYNETDTSDNLFTTAQAIPAAAGYTLPVVTDSGIEATPVGQYGDREVTRFA